MSDIWAPVPGYEGRYFVGAVGAVKSAVTGRVLRSIRHYSGYFQVNLYAGGKSRTFRVHRLVAIAFLPNPLSLPDVNHKDGDKANNRRENLEWCTPAENNKHAIESGLWDRDKICKAVIGVSEKDGGTEVRFESMIDAERYFSRRGGPSALVSTCVSGKIRSAYGYVWRLA